MRRPFLPPRGDARPPWPFELNQQSQQAQGLIAWWPLGHEVSGTTIEDFGPNLFHLTYEGTAQPSQGSDPVMGAGWSMANGSNYGCPAAGFGNINSEDDPHTIAIWMRPDVLAGNSAFFTWENDAGVSGHQLSWRGAVTAFRWSVSSAFTIDSSTITAGNVYLIVLVVRGATDRQIYTNGLAGNSSATSTSDSTASWEFHIRCNNTSLQTMFDVRVYDRALTDGEIWHLYDPATRWELYGKPNSQVYFDVGGGAEPPLTTHPGWFYASKGGWF
jgi:hypothetical protein